MTTLPSVDAVPTIGLRLDGANVSGEAFFEAGKSLLALLREVGRSVSSEQAIAWNLADLQRGSALVALCPPAEAAENASHTIARTLSGLRAVERTASRPEFFSDEALGSVRKLVTHMENGSGGLEVFSTGVGLEAPSVLITDQIAANLKKLHRPGWRAIGSVRGTLEMMTIHGGSMFAVYDELSGERIECRCSPDLMEEAAPLFGKRVLVRGEIVRDSKGRRLASTSSLRPLSTEQSPRAEDLRGLLADNPIDLEEWGRYVRED